MAKELLLRKSKNGPDINAFVRTNSGMVFGQNPRGHPEMTTAHMFYSPYRFKPYVFNMFMATHTYINLGES